MTQSKLIKRHEAPTPKARTLRPTTKARATVQEWVKQYKTAQSESARASFDALFIGTSIG